MGETAGEAGVMHRMYDYQNYCSMYVRRKKRGKVYVPHLTDDRPKVALVFLIGVHHTPQARGEGGAERSSV